MCARSFLRWCKTCRQETSYNFSEHYRRPSERPSRHACAPCAMPSSSPVTQFQWVPCSSPPSTFKTNFYQSKALHQLPKPTCIILRPYIHKPGPGRPNTRIQKFRTPKGGPPMSCKAPTSDANHENRNGPALAGCGLPGPPGPSASGASASQARATRAMAQEWPISLVPLPTLPLN